MQIIKHDPNNRIEAHPCDLVIRKIANNPLSYNVSKIKTPR